VHGPTCIFWANLTPFSLQWAGIDCELRSVRFPEEFATLQAAIDYASLGEVILVQPGVYSGPGNVNLRLSGKAIEIRSTDSVVELGPERTVIDCLGAAAHGFILDDEEGPGTIIAGLTVRNCRTSAFLVRALPSFPSHLNSLVDNSCVLNLKFTGLTHKLCQLLRLLKGFSVKLLGQLVNFGSTL
jgi:hypothetical protein